MLNLLSPERCPMCGAPGHNCGAGHEPKNRDMISIPKEPTKMIATHVALHHIYECDESGEPQTLAYAPGDRVKPEHVESLLEAGAKLGDANLEGNALRAAIAQAKSELAEERAQEAQEASEGEKGEPEGDDAPQGEPEPHGEPEEPSEETEEPSEETETETKEDPMTPETKDVRGPKDAPKGKNKGGKE